MFIKINKQGKSNQQIKPATKNIRGIKHPCIFSHAFSYLGLFTTLLSPHCFATMMHDEYRMRQPHSDFDASHSYYSELLELALKETEEDHGEGRIIYQANVNQGRELLELERGNIINIAMVGTNHQREKTLIPIRIPLNKGVLGNRVFIIHKDKEKAFNKIKTLEQLKKMTACQGQHWPDSDIMEAAGFTVIRNQDYENMFQQLNYKRCDFFPRGINEGFAEVKAREERYPELMLYEKLVLSYTFPMYFFISPKHPNLANRLRKGMASLLEKGRLDRHVREHPVTRSLFPLNKWKDTLEFHIDNTLLPQKTPVNDPRLWLRIPFKQPEN